MAEREPALVTQLRDSEWCNSRIVCPPILPIIAGEAKEVVVAADDSIRAESTVESLAKASAERQSAISAGRWLARWSC